MASEYDYFSLTLYCTVEGNIPPGSKKTIEFASRYSTEFDQKFPVGTQEILPKSWSKPYSPETAREVTQEDRKAISSAIYHFDKATKAAFSDFWGDCQYEIIAESLYEVSLGCVRLKKKYTVKTEKKGGFDVKSLLAGIMIACAPMVVQPGYDKMFDPGPVIECEIYPTERQAIKDHAFDVLETNEDGFFSSECVHLRQKVLQQLGYYSGTIDNMYGNKTIEAERSFSFDNDIEASNKFRLYKRAIEKL